MKRRGLTTDEKKLTEEGKSYGVVCRKVRIEDRELRSMGLISGDTFEGIPLILRSHWIIESFVMENEENFCSKENSFPLPFNSISDKKEGIWKVKSEKNIDDKFSEGEERKVDNRRSFVIQVIL